MRYKRKNKKVFPRYYLFYIAMGVVFTLIVSRLLYLQVVLVDEYREKSNSNSYKTVSVSAARGDIVDTDGKIFATSIQSYVLEYNETEESDEYFYDTMTKVFKILDEKGISQTDDFPIVIDENGNFSYKFQGTTEETRRWKELRFKKDRGYDVEVARKLYGDDVRMSTVNNDEKQSEEVDNELMKLTAEEVFNDLCKAYEIDKYPNINNIEKRRLLIIKDSVFIASISGDDPVVIANNIDEETAFIFEQLLSDLPGIIVDKIPMRYYPQGEVGSAFLGYMSSINEWEEQSYAEKGYDASSDTIGAAGIESAYEEYLRGSKGQQRIQVNKQGRTMRILGEVEAYAGDTVQLNIDMDIQKIAEEALDKKLQELQELGPASHDADTTNATRGAAVVMRPTGEILALVSRPGYDPNIFTTPGLLTDDLYNSYFNPDIEVLGLEYIRKRNLTNKVGILTQNEVSTLSTAEKEELLMKKMFPVDEKSGVREDVYDVFPKRFYNYATLTLVPPGSTFKPVTALAGLEEGVITSGTLINDSGVYGKYGFKGACWIYNMYGGGHGPINVKKALEVSCNYFFYDVADRLYNLSGGTEEGLDFIAKYGWSLGLGVPRGSHLKASTGIEISENFGQVYNYESSKNTLTNIHVNRLVDYLQKGINSKDSNPHYKPFDITQSPETGSGKELEAIQTTNEQKKILVDKIKGYMGTKKEELPPSNNIMSDLQGLITNVINSNQNLIDEGYTKADIEDIAWSINQAILDATTEISSPANAYSAAIGQGFNAFTPLQLTSYISTLLNGGVRYEAKLVDKIIDSETGEIIKDIEPEIISSAEFNPKNIEIIKEGMKDVTQGDNGTASNILRDFPIASGGKTGTSNIINQDIDGSVGRDAAGLYVGFAPYDNPEIVVVSIIFDGGHGKPDIAKAVYEEYFKEEILEKYPDYNFTYVKVENEEEPDKKENN